MVPFIGEKMNDKNLDSIANELHSARLTALPVEQISKNNPHLNRMDSYCIQEKQILLRNKMDEKLIGWKMGLTSEAKRKQMNLDSPLYGFLTNKMEVKNNQTFSLNGSIHPKIEPEIVFLISKDLSWPVTREQVLESCSAVAPCMEIIDSRYTEFKYFSMEDVISDNSSSAFFVRGEWVTNFQKTSLLNLKMEMFVDDKLVHSGNSNDISGDPVMSVVDLCQMLSLRGKTLEAGSIVLAGAATPAVELRPNMKVKLKMEGFLDVQISIDANSLSHDLNKEDK
jgi:2-oxo-3-hexenedioate decarboxylase